MGWKRNGLIFLREIDAGCILVECGMGGPISPLMREEKRLILNKNCVGWGEKRGGKTKGRRREVGARALPTRISGLSGKNGALNYFPRL